MKPTNRKNYNQNRKTSPGTISTLLRQSICGQGCLLLSLLLFWILFDGVVFWILFDGVFIFNIPLDSLRANDLSDDTNNDDGILYSPTKDIITQTKAQSFDLRKDVNEDICARRRRDVRKGAELATTKGRVEPARDKRLIQLHKEIVHYRSPLSRAKKSSIDAIQEAQCIQMDLFMELVGQYQYAVLIDVATYENKGDPAIAMGEVLLLKRLGIELFDHCTTGLSCNAKYLQKIKSNIEAQGLGPQDVVILMQGGGNLILYMYNDWLREIAFQTFPGYETVLFPQSVWVPNTTDPDFIHYRDNYRRQSNFTMIMRDFQSLKIAKRHFASPQNRILLAPDMAFQMGSIPRTMHPSYDIMWLMRDDGKSSKYTKPTTNDLENKNITLKVGDYFGSWPSPKVPENDFDQAFAIVQNGFAFLQRGRVLVTDRLHGHILSTILGIPHVILDTAFGKAHQYHATWTEGIENVEIAYNTSHALEIAVEMLQKYDHLLPEKIP